VVGRKHASDQGWRRAWGWSSSVEGVLFFSLFGAYHVGAAYVAGGDFSKSVEDASGEC
jgi:hypothetical protein